MKRVSMPKEGTWFKVGSEVRQHCCRCGEIHLLRFKIVDGEVFVNITLGEEK